MKNALTFSAFLAIIVSFSLPVFGGSLEPLTVSPGSSDRFTGVEVRCPTFSWQAAQGAVGYEVVVYQLPPQTELAAWSLDEAVEVLFVELPVGVTGWTPSLESGLARGAEHVWFVRGVFEDEGEDVTEWSVARFFRVAGTGSEADDVMATRSSVADSGTGSGTGSGSTEARSRGTKAEGGWSAIAKRVGEEKTKDVGTAMTAIKGEMPDTTGETYGVVGISNSLEGGGLAGANTTEGPDLVLDGAANGRTDAYLFDWGLDRSSPGVEVFGFTNEEGGTIDVYVGGDVHARSLFGDGTDVTDVDAETLDGQDGSFFLDWGNLTGVPGDIADGDDDTDTTYTAGTGMQLVGNEFQAMGAGYANVVVVAASGGDFTSIQAAIDSITDASETNPYFVWVAPGVYSEVVTMKPDVHLQGAGRGATVITSSLGNTTWPPDQATVQLSSNSSLTGVSLVNVAAGSVNATAIAAPPGVVETRVTDVDFSVTGANSDNYAFVAVGPDTEVELNRAVGLAENATSGNKTLRLTDASVVAVGGSFETRGGEQSSHAGYVEGASGELYAVDVTFQSVGSAVGNFGVLVGSGAQARIEGGEAIGRGGQVAWGLYVRDEDTSLEISGVSVLASEASGTNIGLANDDGTVTIQGGRISGSGGNHSKGIYHSTSLTSGRLEVDDAIVEGLGGNSYAFGIHCPPGETTTIVRDSTVVGRGTTISVGVWIGDPEAKVEGSNLYVIGEGGSLWNAGLLNYGTADLNGGTVLGRGGDQAWGVDNDGDLDATNLRIVGEAGLLETEGLQNRGDGTARVGVTQFVGGVDPGGSSITCFHTYDDTYGLYECIPVKD